MVKNGKSEKEIVEADAEVKKTVEKILQDVAKKVMKQLESFQLNLIIIHLTILF